VRPVTDERGEVTLLVPEGRDITQRKNQERKRQQIIDRVTDAIVEVDSDWTFTLVNDQAEKLYDIAEEDLLGRDFWDVFSGALDTRFEEIYREVMETREPASFVEHYPGLDGWFDIQIYPEDNGGLAFYFQEVTERIHRSRELEQTRELLGHTEQIADVGGWEIDTGKQDVFWTEHLPEMLGRDYDEEPPLEEALDVYVEEDRPRVENAVEEALAAGDSFNVEARFERPDGEIRWFQIRGEPTVEDGEVVTLRGAVQDITERKERERELEVTEARFQALAENFPNGGVHYFDEDFRYEYVAGGASSQSTRRRKISKVIRSTRLSRTRRKSPRHSKRLSNRRSQATRKTSRLAMRATCTNSGLSRFGMRPEPSSAASSSPRISQTSAAGNANSKVRTNA
jgi:PAS domain S-box-containing protein